MHPYPRCSSRHGCYPEHEGEIWEYFRSSSLQGAETTGDLGSVLKYLISTRPVWQTQAQNFCLWWQPLPGLPLNKTVYKKRASSPIFSTAGATFSIVELPHSRSIATRVVEYGKRTIPIFGHHNFHRVFEDGAGTTSKQALAPTNKRFHLLMLRTTSFSDHRDSDSDNHVGSPPALDGQIEKSCAFLWFLRTQAWVDISAESAPYLRPAQRDKRRCLWIDEPLSARAVESTLLVFPLEGVDEKMCYLLCSPQTQAG
jgi:hypothetical protein